MAAEDGSNGAWRGDIVGRCSTFIASSFHKSAEQKAGRPRRFAIFVAVLTFLIANDKMLIKFYYLFGTASSSNQKSSLSFDAISKLFHYTNSGNYSIQYYHIINLNGFIDYLNNTGELPL